MTNYKKYQKVRRMGDAYTEGILNGNVVIQPKLDGANGSVWYDSKSETIKCGSRNNELSEENTNRGFWNYVQENEGLKEFCMNYPDVKFFGEWMVKHTFDKYYDDVWNKFFIFDAYVDGVGYVPIDSYLNKQYDINVIPNITELKNPTTEEVFKYAKSDTPFTPLGTPGEGIVIKNYEFKDRFGKQQWGKIINDEFRKTKMTNTNNKKHSAGLQEVDIIDEFVTEAFIKKELSKMGYTVENYPNEIIGKFIGFTWKTFIEEESFNILSKFNRPTINFKFLNKLFVDKIKEVLNI